MAMTATEALKSVQFVVDNEGQRTAVLLGIQAWETLVDLIEDVTDTKVVSQALQELQAAGGRPQQAVWLDWDDIREDWRRGSVSRTDPGAEL